MAEDFEVNNGWLTKYNGPGGDVVIPEGVKIVGKQAFSNNSALKTVTIPPEVTQINYAAFSRCWELERVTILGSETKIGNDVFYICPKLVLIAPHLIPSQFKNRDERIALVLGWMMNRALYSEEISGAYINYARSQKKALQEAAEQRSGAVKEAADAYYYGSKPSRPSKPRSNGKLSEQKKVYLLEEAVLSGSMEKVEEVLTAYQDFEFMARALGLACRFGSLEMVQRLVKAGADFDLRESDASLKSKYDTYTVYRGIFGTDVFYHYFDTMLFAETVNDLRNFGTFRGIRSQFLLSASETEATDFEVFIPDHPAKDADSSIEMERRPIDEAERLAILRWLAHQKKAKLHGSLLIYRALRDGQNAFADALIEEGVRLEDFDVSRQDTETRLRMVPRMLDIARKQGMKMPAPLALLTSVVEDADLVRRLLDEGETPAKLDTTKLLKSSMNASGAGTLALCLERGFLKSIATREKLIAQSIEEKKTEHTAVLLDYKNRTADLAKEAAAQEARDMKDLTADPNSAYIMKKLWRYGKQKDGTIILTGYKGPGGEVYVPDKIGKVPVTAIGPEAFSPASGEHLSGGQRDARRDITSVTIPDGIKTIGEEAFAGCKNLERANLPDSLQSIGKKAFENCCALKRIVIPKGVKKLADGLFENCVFLTEVVLPDGLLSIGDGTFSICVRLSGLEIPKTVRKIEGAAFQSCKQLTKLVIPEGVRALNRFTFYNCDTLTDITIPKSVTKIDIPFGYYNAAAPGLVIRGVPGTAAESLARTVRKTFRPL